MAARRVVVVGSGAAGTAAALVASAAGAHVTLVRGRPGATSLTSGAIDSCWEGRRSRPLPTAGNGDDAGARVVLDALGVYALGACTLATAAGTMRVAAGRDRALLDVPPSGNVLVARVAHPSWDGDALAAGYAESDPGRSYVARDVGLVLHTSERAMSHTELAALHDDEARLGRAAERVRGAIAEGGSFGAVLLPPWLGVSAPRAEALSQLVSAKCGEVLVGLDSPTGARFERARDRALAKAGVEVLEGRVLGVSGSPPKVETSERTIEADAVVLATGGLLGGGIAYTPGDASHARATPPPTRAAFALTYDAPVTLGFDGSPLVVPGSLFGIPPESLVWPFAESPVIERIGVLSAPRGIYVAGDAMADQPRTMLAAFASGAAAGRAASER